MKAAQPALWVRIAFGKVLAKNILLKRGSSVLIQNLYAEDHRR